jgi:hypothetical protein
MALQDDSKYFRPPWRESHNFQVFLNLRCSCGKWQEVADGVQFSSAAKAKNLKQVFRDVEIVRGGVLDATEEEL